MSAPLDIEAVVDAIVETALVFRFIYNVEANVEIAFVLIQDAIGINAVHHHFPISSWDKTAVTVWI